MWERFLNVGFRNHCFVVFVSFRVKTESRFAKWLTRFTERMRNAHARVLRTNSVDLQITLSGQICRINVRLVTVVVVAIPEWTGSAVGGGGVRWGGVPVFLHCTGCCTCSYCNAPSVRHTASEADPKIQPDH